MGNNIIVIGDSAREVYILKEQLISIGEKDLVFLDPKGISSISCEEYPCKLIIYITPRLNAYSLTIFKSILYAFQSKPIMVISGDDTEMGLKMVSLGAQDHLVQGQYSTPLLKKSIYYAIERSAMLKEIDKTKNEYKGIFMDNPNPMWIFDPETYRFLQVNQAAMDHYGYTKEEFLSMTILDIRSKSDADKLQEMVKQQKTEGVTDAGIWKHKKASGDEFYVHIYSHYTSFESKKTRLVVAIDVDKSIRHEQKNNELTQQLEAYSKRINTILNSITDGFFAVDKQWNFIYTNRVFEQIFSKRKEELIGQNVWEIFPEEFTKRIAPKYEQAVKTNKNFHFEEYLNTKNMWFSVSVYPSEEGLSVYIQDITRSKNLKEKIFNEQIKLNTLINNTEDLIWSIDKHHTLLSANNAFKAVMKKHDMQGIQQGQNIMINGISDSRKAKWEAYYQRALAGESYKIECEMDVSPGSILEVSFNPIKDHRGEIFGVGCYARDITERKRHEQTMKKHNKLLEEIAWKQSHKMRGPVASIMGLMQMVDYENLNTPFNKELLQHLKVTTEQLDIMIREIVKSTISLDNH